MILYFAIWLQIEADRRAVTALEYGLNAGVIVATIMVGFRVLANAESASFSTIGGKL